jgi:hypothetical protein
VSFKWKEAVENAETYIPDVVLMIYMAGMDEQLQPRKIVKSISYSGK